MKALLMKVSIQTAHTTCAYATSLNRDVCGTWSVEAADVSNSVFNIVFIPTHIDYYCRKCTAVTNY